MPLTCPRSEYRLQSSTGNVIDLRLFDPLDSSVASLRSRVLRTYDPITKLFSSHSATELAAIREGKSDRDLTLSLDLVIDCEKVRYSSLSPVRERTLTKTPLTFTVPSTLWRRTLFLVVHQAEEA